MSIPSIGQIVRLQPIVLDDEIENKIYKTRVADITETHILFEHPIEEGSGRPLTLLKGTEFFFSYFIIDGTQCRFRSRLVGRKVENISLILVDLPPKEDIEKSQRRGFLRVDAYVDLAIKLEQPDRVYHLVTRSTDIGGGGLSFDCSTAYTFKEGDPLKLWFVLPLKDHGIIRFALDGEVVRAKPSEVARILPISVKFNSLKDREYQLIMRYCFERQLELYKKGIG